MPVRLRQPYMDQAANTLWWGAQQSDLIANGVADTLVDQASDYAETTRVVTTATATVSSHANIFKMNSGTAQTVTLPLTGYFPDSMVLTFEQLGAGATTIIPAAGVTINNSTSSLVTKGINTVNQLLKTGPNTWMVASGFGG